MRGGVLIVLDGWGVKKGGKKDAISTAKTPHMDRFLKEESTCILKAAGEHVGLAKGYMGNSEVGHLHIGAGRLVLQDMMRIFSSIEDGSLMSNKVLVDAMKTTGTVHLLGMVSDAGVHSHIDHLFGLLDMAKRLKVKKLVVDAITDGRDTPPRVAKKYIKKVEKKLAACDKNWRIASVSGRYYAMDRDKRWDRTAKAYDCLVKGVGESASSALEAVDRSYKAGKGDEFILPTVIGDGVPVSSGDSVIFFNFRTDRTRQLSHAFCDSKFDSFERKKVKVKFVCMTEYDPSIKAPVAFPPRVLSKTMGEIVSRAGMKQYRIAETEKYNHVTFFFNGLSAKKFRGEERATIPSPRVATYDEDPAMSADKIKEFTLSVLNKGKHGFLLINFANADMVGHTGDFAATVRGVEAVDRCVGEIVELATQKGFVVGITADHGNAEDMSAKWETSHTINDVPFIVIGEQVKLAKGHLYDVAPTMLTLMGLKVPKEMTGSVLFST